jgi:hypothetical protein
MALYVNETDLYREIGDDFSGRIFKQEYKCAGCGEWVEHEDVIWAHDDGTLNTDTGKSWCEGCCPEEPEYDKYD